MFSKFIIEKKPSEFGNSNSISPSRAIKKINQGIEKSLNSFVNMKSKKISTIASAQNLPTSTQIKGKNGRNKFDLDNFSTLNRKEE